MPKQYKITMKDVPGVSKSLTPASLKVTFLPGKPLVTSSAAVARYAQRRPTTFAIEVIAEKKTKKTKLEPAPPTPEPAIEIEPEEEPEVDPVEAWMELVSKSKSGLPKNDQIKVFADEHGIDLDGASTKDDMIMAVEDALEVE